MCMGWSLLNGIVTWLRISSYYSCVCVVTTSDIFVVIPLEMLLFLLMWTVVHPVEAQYLTTMKVNPINGTDDPTCWNGSVTCKSLNFALRGVVYDNTIIQLSSGSMNLSSSNTTLSGLFGITNFTIVGTGITNSTVQCNSSNAGLYFVGITNLTLANFTITNCSMLQNSTTWNNSSPVQYLSAVTIYNSSYVTIKSMSLSHNNGISLSIVNTGKYVTIRESIFDNNYVINGDQAGGGGLYIEFPFCLPDKFCDYSRPSDNYLSVKSHYVIDSCNFTNNAAKKIRKALQVSSKSLFTYNEPTFGHGGGMSVFFRGNSADNTIDIINTKFIGNTAVWGGGLFIEFSHYASNNTISVKNNSQFSTNHCGDNENPEDPGGGGVQVLYNFYNTMVLPRHNSVNFYQSYFVFNTAYWGGAVGYSLGKAHYVHGINLLYFFNCSWYGNQAKFGAAVDLYRPLSSGIAQAVVFENCSFVSNSAFYHLQIDQFELRGAGIVYANSIVISFKGFVKFTNNSGTALVLFTSYIDVTDECNVTFTQNTGWRGGAVSLLASSWIKLGENTTVRFDRNNADELGGAIYTELISEHKVVTQWNCFLQFTNPTVSPDDWNTKVQFNQNYAVFGGHSIYATTLHSCVWNKDSTHLDVGDARKVFHWKSFKFNGEPGTHSFSRKYEIATATNNLTTCQSAIKVSPGEKCLLPFKHVDDEGHNASAIFFVQSDNTTAGNVDDQSRYVYGDITQLYGEPNTNFNITVTSLAPIPYSVTMNVTFDYCPPGYIAYKKGKYNNSTSCKCANSHSDGVPGISECNETLYRAYITRYHWGGIHEPSGKFVTAVCPQDYCTFAKSKYNSLLPRKRFELDSFQCQDQYRTGDICGECMSGYGISSQSNCIKCTHGTLKGLGLFLAFECLPTVVFISIILFFNVNITSGYWNSLIFYFQVVEILNLYALQSIEEYSEGFQIVINIHNYLFGIWNLEYYSPDVCYINGIKNVFLLYALQYFTVVIAFTLALVLIGIKNLPCGCRYQSQNAGTAANGCVHRFKKQYNKAIQIYNKWFGGRSKLIHGLATVLVLSYTKIALLSMKFFIPGPMYSSYDEVIETRVHHVGTMKYFQGQHLYYVIPAMVLLLLSAMVPLYLILKSACQIIYLKYHYPWCSKVDKALNFCFNSDKVEQFLQAFYGSFKDNRRFYGGFFFIYRLALYFTFAFTPSLMVQYCVQQCLLGFFLFVHSILQPYNEHFAFANMLDALIFMNLIVINALSTYNFYSVIDIQSDSQAALAVQLVFIYLPLLYIPFRFIWYWRSRNGQAHEHNTDHNQQLNNMAAEGDVDPEGLREIDKLLLNQSIDLTGYDNLPSLTHINTPTNTTSMNISQPPPVVERIQN